MYQNSKLVEFGHDSRPRLDIDTSRKYFTHIVSRVRPIISVTIAQFFVRQDRTRMVTMSVQPEVKKCAIRAGKVTIVRSPFVPKAVQPNMAYVIHRSNVDANLATKATNVTNVSLIRSVDMEPAPSPATVSAKRAGVEFFVIKVRIRLELISLIQFN